MSPFFYLKVYILRLLTRLFAWRDRRGGPLRPPGPSLRVNIPSAISDSKGTFDLFFYFPPGYDRNDSKENRYPVVVNFHGGGYCVGHARDDERFIAELTSRGAIVASVNYRLAPESPYPAAIEDCLDALLYIWRNAASLHIDKHRTILSGSSAGGHLAFASLLMLWKRMKDKNLQIDPSSLGTVKGLMAFYPVMDMTKTRAERALSNPAFSALKKKPASSSKLIGSVFDEAFFWNLKEKPDKSFMYLSPGLAPEDSLKEALPPIISFKLAGLDYLLSEEKEAVRRLKLLGKQVDCEVVEEVPHYWDHMARTTEMKELRDKFLGKAAEEIEQIWQS
ncbi:Alpha/Beta hydrolase protein [Aspergillus pseudocaelatus]|uniref:Alpha/Beta hydrolase protein n=1 Tax=Aspergillus pseudocaelatus TaxID=1825620 RepID=A0ABQ6WB88_9EURO|nr:Alpha/Beta hydrolase protein [Aspergillus pseudocaelatus]